MLIEDDLEKGEKNQRLKEVIVSHVDAQDRGVVVIRFAWVSMEKYSRRLGRSERKRVFASDLTEVWNLKVKDAADRSGYSFSSGDTFFVWIFVSTHPDEFVPATWGQVLDHLPHWIKDS